MALWIIAGGESMDELTGTFDSYNNNWFEANSGIRYAYQFNNGSAKQLIATLKGNRTRVWSKFWLARNGQLSTGKFFLAYYDGASERLRFRLTFVAGVGTCIVAETVNGATVTALFTTALPFYSETGNVSANTNVLGNIHIDVNYAAAGWVRVYRNSDLAGEFLGDPRVGGSTFLTEGRIQNPSTAGSWAEAAFSQVIFGDEDTRGLRIGTLNPNANGDVNTFSSGAFTNIDEVGESGTDYNESQVAAQKFLANFSNVPAVFGGSPLIRSLHVRSRVQAAPAGSGAPTKFKHLLKTGGVEYQGPLQSPSDTVFTLHDDEYATNPGTSAAWTKAELDAIQLGHLSEA